MKKTTRVIQTIEVTNDVFVDIEKAEGYAYKGKKCKGVVFIVRWETTDGAGRPKPVKINLTPKTFEKLRTINTKTVELLFK